MTTRKAIVVEVTSGNLANNCASQSKFNRDINVKLDLFQRMQRFTREGVSEHHPLYSSFCKFLYTAFTVEEQADLEKLKEVYICGIVPANPTKQHIWEHCRTKVSTPKRASEKSGICSTTLPPSQEPQRCPALQDVNAEGMVNPVCTHSERLPE